MKINTDKPYKIFAEVVEDTALAQFEGCMNQQFAVKGALMPDAHTGYTAAIGSVVATRDVVVPAWVGYDIGCGMCAIPTSFNVEDIRANQMAVYNAILSVIPVGFNRNAKDTQWDIADSIDRSDAVQAIFTCDGLKQLASLGGGNHFIEIGADTKTDQVWIIIHSGSRGVGHAVATHYMKLASGDGKAREGHFGLDVNSEDGKNYIKDLNFMLQFALQNRLEMAERIANVLRTKFKFEGVGLFSQLINRNHNHAEFKDGLWIHRKGATHAEAGMLGVIPGNMRDGSFIVSGKGNPDSLCSSSHGAGRVMGRKEAGRRLKVEDFAKSMVGIQANVSTDTLDESPDAYKNIFDVMKLQADLVSVVAYIKPIVNVKG